MFSRRVFRKCLARFLNCHSCAFASATLVYHCSSVLVCVSYTRRNLRVPIVYTALSALLYILGLGRQFCLLVIARDVVFLSTVLLDLSLSMKWIQLGHSVLQYVRYDTTWQAGTYVLQNIEYSIRYRTSRPLSTIFVTKVFRCIRTKYGVHRQGVRSVHRCAAPEFTFAKIWLIPRWHLQLVG